MSEVHVYGYCENKCRREVMLKTDLETKFSEIDTSLEEVNVDITEINAGITNIKNGTTQVGSAANADTATSASSATSATKLATARKINGVAFNGTADITITDDTKSPTSHTHGSMSTITYATAEPTSVATGEIVMVYEE